MSHGSNACAFLINLFIDHLQSLNILRKCDIFEKWMYDKLSLDIVYVIHIYIYPSQKTK